MRTFTIVWAGQFISQIGSRLSAFALGIWVFQNTGSATLFALIAMFSLLLAVLISPLAGLVADRYSRRGLMIAGDTGAALCTLAVAGLLTFGHLEIWQIYLTQALAAAFTSFQAPAFAAAITQLVPREQLARAAGLNQLADGLSLVIAAPLAGLLIGPIGLAGIVALDLLTFAIAVSMLLLIRFPPTPRAERPAGEGWGPLLRESAAGMRYVLAHPGLLGINLVAALMNFAIGVVSALLNPMLLSFSTAAAAGVVNAILGLGSVAGSVLMSVWQGPPRRIDGFLSFAIVNGLFVAIAGLRPSVPLVAAAMFIAFAGVPMASVCASVIWRTRVPLDLQGRVFAFNRMVATAALPLAFLISGPLADRVFEPLMQPGGGLAPALGPLLGLGPGRGIGLIFILTGGLMLLAAAIGYGSPRVRNVERELPDQLPTPTSAAV